MTKTDFFEIRAAVSKCLLWRLLRTSLKPNAEPENVQMITNGTWEIPKNRTMVRLKYPVFGAPTGGP